MATRALENMSIDAFSDREILSLINDLSDNEGWVTSETLAERLSLASDHPKQCVGIRLGWMRRFGLVDRADDGRWSLTQEGEALRRGTLTAQQERALENIRSDQALTATTMFASRYRYLPQAAATAMRREWRHVTGLR